MTELLRDEFGLKTHRWILAGRPDTWTDPRSNREARPFGTPGDSCS